MKYLKTNSSIKTTIYTQISKPFFQYTPCIHTDEKSHITVKPIASITSPEHGVSRKNWIANEGNGIVTSTCRVLIWVGWWVIAKK